MATNTSILDVVERIEQKVDSNTVSLRGNGKPGLETRVALLESAIVEWRWATRTVIGAALAIIVSQLWQLLVK